MAGQTIRAEQQSLADRQGSSVDLRAELMGVAAKNTPKDMAPARVRRFLGRKDAALDHLLGHRLVLRDPNQTRRMEEIAPAIADVDDVQSWPEKIRHCQRGAHAALLWMRGGGTLDTVLARLHRC